MTQKKEINRYIKKWYQYYLSTINSNDFKNFCTESDKHFADEYSKSIKDDGALSNRIDFQSDAKIKSLTICDMVDKRTYNARLTTHIKHVFEYVDFIVVIVPFVYDIIANVLCKRVIAVSFDRLDIC